MPIDFNRLKLTTDFLTVAPDATVGDVYGQLPKDKRENTAFAYVLLPLPDGTYIVVRWVEIEEIARRFGPGQLRTVKIADIASLPEPSSQPLPDGYAKLAGYSFKDLQRLLTPVQAVEKDGVTTQEARELRDEHPADRLVVLSGGQVIGFLASETLAGETLGGDPFARGGATLSIDQGTRDRGGSEPPRLAQASPGEEPAGEKPAERTWNYWMQELNETGTSTALSRTTPLKLGRTYELKINLAARREDAFATESAEHFAEVESELDPEQKIIDVLIVLSSEDFTFYGSTEQILSIERGGFSKNTATFTLEPKQEGVGSIVASFFAGNRCFQQVEFTLRVGAAGSGDALQAKTTRGKQLGAAMKMPARPEEQSVSLVIVRRESGYQFILNGGGVKRANINASEAQIAQQIDEARKALREIVDTPGPDGPIYQHENTSIPADVHAAAVKKLVRPGALLFERLFNIGQNEDAKAMGRLLRKISQENQLHIEVIAERFILPWAMIYDGDARAAEPDPRHFWGFKHVIEYLPEFTTATPVNFSPQITVSGSLPLGLVFNTQIDAELTAKGYATVIEPQTQFFKQLPNVTTATYTTRQELLDLLQNADAPPLIYINCHAVSNPEGAGGSAYRSMIRLGDGDININDLDFDAPPIEGGLKNAPLVFLNACQSGELLPYFYVGLVPAMIERGARGVIGTEVDTPALFAAEFAMEFLRRFTAGDKPLGELLLELRREYLEKKNNIMGLVYALYSSGEVVIRRA